MLLTKQERDKAAHLVRQYLLKGIFPDEEGEIYEIITAAHGYVHYIDRYPNGDTAMAVPQRRRLKRVEGLSKAIRRRDFLIQEYTMTGVIIDLELFLTEDMSEDPAVYKYPCSDLSVGARRVTGGEP